MGSGAYFTAALLLLGGWLLSKLMRPLTIFEYETGLRYDGGRFIRLLGPGRYWLWQPMTTIRKVDRRIRLVTLAGQELLTTDHITIKITLAARFRVADPVKVVHEIEDYQGAIYLELQLVLRQMVGSVTIDQLLNQRTLFGEQLLAAAAPKVAIFGVELLGADVKDIMFPGHLKEMFAQVVAARKGGEAALEKARGETAALRQLNNAAQMMQRNPALMTLRLVQSLGESSGNHLSVTLQPPLAGTDEEGKL